MIMLRNLYTTLVNCHFSIKNKHGWKEKVTCVTFRWTPMMAQKCVNLFKFYKVQWSTDGKDKETATKSV